MSVKHRLAAAPGPNDSVDVQRKKSFAVPEVDAISVVAVLLRLFGFESDA